MKPGYISDLLRGLLTSREDVKGKWSQKKTISLVNNELFNDDKNTTQSIN